MSEQFYIGLDPSASPLKPSGICVLNQQAKIIHIGKWMEFSEIAEILESLMGQVHSVAIDGPFQPPHELDRCCFSSNSGDCEHKQTTPFKGRYCEQLLIKRGYRCFVSSKKSFAKKWVNRCFLLNDFIKESGIKTLEVFPYATRKILFTHLKGQKQQKVFRIKLQSHLIQFGINFPFHPKVYSHDELDAVLAAVTGLLHAQSKSEALGDDLDGYIVIPCSGVSGITLSQM